MSNEADTIQNLTNDVAIVQRIFAAIDAFENTQQELREYGANDTEPDAVFQRLLWLAVCGERPDVPSTELTWNLYASSMDCEKAARTLHDRAKIAVDLIEDCPIRYLKRLQTRIKVYCWRLDV